MGIESVTALHLGQKTQISKCAQIIWNVTDLLTDTIQVISKLSGFVIAGQENLSIPAFDFEFDGTFCNKTHMWCLVLHSNWQDKRPFQN